jgi:hypothetical protein
MNDHRSGPTRRTLIGAVVGGLAATVVAATRAETPSSASPGDLDPIRTELVLNIVVTCSSPERMGPNSASKDGTRDEIWPIIGGRFEGRGIRGTVVPGGGDFPLTRPDGVEVIDALYRLKTDDGVTIIIHNKGLAYPQGAKEWPRYRLVPEFTAPAGKYDWLNKSIFIAALVEVPAAMALARGEKENDRLIQVHRVM